MESLAEFNFLIDFRPLRISMACLKNQKRGLVKLLTSEISLRIDSQDAIKWIKHEIELQCFFVPAVKPELGGP